MHRRVPRGVGLQVSAVHRREPFDAGLALLLVAQVRCLGLGRDLEVSKQGASRRRLKLIRPLGVVDPILMGWRFAVGNPHFRQHGDRARCDLVDKHAGFAVLIVGCDDASNLRQRSLPLTYHSRLAPSQPNNPSRDRVQPKGGRASIPPFASSFLAQRQNRHENDSSIDDVAHGVGERCACEQRLQRGEKQYATQHSDVAATAAGNQRTADDDHRD
jgi:hypothetical protein